MITDRISNYLFCPTNIAYNNLVDEGYKNFDAYFENVGDVMFDVFKDNIDKFDIKLNFSKFNINEKYILCTLHRAENTNCKETLSFYINNLNNLSKNIKIILPGHPRLLQYLKSFDLKLSKNINFIPPVSYIEMLFLIKHSEMVITDSGGLQKDAFFSKKYCITLRTETEWTELVHHNYNILFNKKVLISLEEVFNSIDNNNLNFISNFYGNGNSAKKIITKLINS